MHIEHLGVGAVFEDEEADEGVGGCGCEEGCDWEKHQDGVWKEVGVVIKIK